MKKLVFIILLVAIIFISGCISQQEKTEESSKLDVFAKCLTEKGVKMYGSITCSICAKERELFGSSFQYIEEVECHPRGKNPQTELCLKKDIKKTPTWILEKDGVELKRLDGYQTFETLSEFSGCSFEGK